MNLYESIKNNHNKEVPKKQIKESIKRLTKKSLKESAEGNQEFWNKVANQEVKVGDVVTMDDSLGSKAEILELGGNYYDYILIKRNFSNGRSEYVAAWAPEFNGDKLTWGQGHYFDDEEAARKYYRGKVGRLTTYESCKGKACKGKKKLKESDHSAQMQNIIDKMRNGEYSDDELSMIYWFAQGPIVDDLEPGEVFSEDIIDTEIDNADYELEEHNYHYPDDIWDAPDHDMIKGVAKDFYGLTGEEVGKCFDEIHKIYTSKKESCDKKKNEIKEGEIVNNKFVMEPGDAEKFEKVYTESDKYDGIWGKYLGVARFDNYLIFSDLGSSIVIDIVNNTIKKVDHNGAELQLTDSDLEALYNTVHDETLQESCGKKKRVSMKESNPAKYLGIKESLTEKVNQANADINAKIKEALRSKSAARKYAKDFEQAGITVDDSPREGVILIGPNGRKLSADRQNIYGPTRPGHNDTHDSYRRGSIRSQRQDLDAYDHRIKKSQEELDELNNKSRDDIIRMYPNKSTEDAIATNEDNKRYAQERIDSAKRYRKQTEDEIADIRSRRDKAHKSFIPQNGWDSETTIAKDAVYKDPKNGGGRKVVDAIDYKGYLDSKDTNENKEYTNDKRTLRATPGQKLRGELRDAKRKVADTTWGYEAKRIKNNRAIDDKFLDQRKKDIEEEYKRKLNDEVESLKKAKADADKEYSANKEQYKKNVADLNNFRKMHGIKAKASDDYDTYLDKKSW